jgi:hypothetical protein
MAELNFDANSVAPAQAFDVLPAGKYKMQVVDSDMRPTKDGNGAYLWLELEILDGEFQGRKMWDRLNIQNQNAQAVEIAQRALSALCHATGKLHVSDSKDLHFIPVVATVKVRAPRAGYDASNEIRGYEGAGNVAPVSRFPTAARPAPAANPNPVASGNPMPWRRGAA